MEPREPMQHIGEDASLPLGSCERFAGYAAIRHALSLADKPLVASRTWWPGVIAEKNTGTD